jgi:hypothetical protein
MLFLFPDADAAPNAVPVPSPVPAPELSVAIAWMSRSIRKHFEPQA